MNYGELKQEILDVAKLTLADTVGARVAAFVRRAEGMIAQHVRALEMLTTTTVLEASRISGGLYSAPTNALELVKVIDASSRMELSKVGLGGLYRFRTDELPHSWAPRGQGGALAFELRGTPASGSSYNVLHFARPTALSNASDGNGLLTNYESLYMNGALHWLYLDAMQVELATAHKAGFLEDAAMITETARTALRGGVTFNDYVQITGGSAM